MNKIWRIRCLVAGLIVLLIVSGMVGIVSATDSLSYGNKVALRNVNIPDFGPKILEDIKRYEPTCIEAFGKIPSFKNDYERKIWLDKLDIIGNKVLNKIPYEPPGPEGPVIAYGYSVYGYFFVDIHKDYPYNQTMLREIYDVISMYAREEGIDDIPVVFRKSLPPIPDVIVLNSSNVTAKSGRDDRYRPIIGGVRVENCDPDYSGCCFASTLGFPAKKGVCNYGYVVSGHLGCDRPTQVGTTMYQPKCCSVENEAGNVAEVGGYWADAAWVPFWSVYPDILLDGGNRITVDGYFDPWLGDTVYKSGITTGLTMGEVVECCIEVSHPVFGELYCQYMATFDAEPGDSGAPVYWWDGGYGHYIEGILWGKCCWPFFDKAVFSPISGVIADLGVEPVTADDVSSPQPKVVTVDYPSEIEIGSWAEIYVKVKNEGEVSYWQTVHISFPDITDTSNIKIVDTDIDGARIYKPGEEVWCNYGEGKCILKYPMVEGAPGCWQNGEIHYLKVKVKPERSGEFKFYVKSVAGRVPDGECVAWDPTSGTKDQQNEYVYVYTINVPKPPKIRVEPTTLHFGEVEIGDYKLEVVTIYNDGDATLTINSITRQSGDPDFKYYPFDTPDTRPPFDIPPGDSRDICFKFEPSTLGFKSAEFKISCNDPKNPDVTVYMDGTGTDTTPPEAWHSLSPASPDGENGWYISPVKVTLSATDDGSGVDYIKYKIDYGSWQTYHDPFTVSDDGQHTVYYYAVDKAGNKGSQKTCSFKIDRTKPPAPTPDDGVEGWSNDNTPTFTWSKPSDTSGIAGYYWKVDSGSEKWTTSTSVTLPAQSDGEHMFYVRAKDNAGNIGDYGSHKFRIDTKAPSASCTLSPALPDGENGWYVSPVRVTLSASDPTPGSGVKKIHYRIDGSSWQESTSVSVTFTISSDGKHEVEYYAEDNAGNKGKTKTCEFKIDKTKPPAPSPDDGVEGWSNDSSPTFTWDEPSDMSGIAGYYWKVDSGPDNWTTSTSVTLPAQPDGEHTFYVRAKDNAGNIGDYGSHKFKIDTTPPSSEVKELPKVQTSTTFTVSWEGSDALSGIRWYDVQYKKDNGSWTDWLTHTTLTSEQFTGERGHTYYFRCRAQDNAGNWEDYGEADTYTYIERQNSPPNKPSNPSPSDGATNVPIDTDLSWSCSDPDGDALKYDIYFGTSNPPPLVKNDHTSTTYDPGILEYNTKYYWKIVAKDEYGAKTEGDVWSFTTASPPPDTFGVDLSCENSNKYVAPGETATYKIMVKNTGNRQDTISLSHSTPPSGWTASLDKTSVVLNAGETTEVTLNVTPPKNAKDGDYALIDVIGKSKGNPSKSDVVTTNTTVMKENQPPVASFTYSPQHPKVNENITFNASPSYDPDGFITNYEWDFGDGNITNTTEKTINHSYSETGSYEVTLTVTDDDGATNSISKPITVLGEATTLSITPPAQEVLPNESFTVNVTVDPAVPIAGVQFDLSFNSSLLTANSVTEGNLLSQNGADTYFSPGTIDNNAGTITGVAGAIITPGQTVSSPGVFATIHMTAKSVEGTSPLNLSNVIVGDINGNPVPVTVNNGSVTVTPYPDWDVNCDGHVNVLDMIRVGQHWGETGTPHWIREDVNRDGSVNVLDMIVIGQHWTG